MPSIPLSILDVAPVGAGTTPSDALRASLDLARLADRLGYARYWFAEHHSMPGIASSAPEVLIAHVAAHTTRIRVGSGGIMLPNHVPLRVAETFHTLEALHPGRIDLGLGRAPGTDQGTVQALRPFDAEQYPDQVAELEALSSGAYPPGHPFASIRVMPGDVRLPPLYLLGSSGGSARLAGSIGAGYAFARHFSPAPPMPAIRAYRENFRPSPSHARAHVIVCVSVVCADTDEEARRLASSTKLMWVRMQRGELAPIPTPEEALAYPYTPMEEAMVGRQLALQIVGTPERVRDTLAQVAREAGADELMLTTIVHDPAARQRSFTLVGEAWGLDAVSTGADVPGRARDAA